MLGNVPRGEHHIHVTLAHVTSAGKMVSHAATRLHWPMLCFNMNSDIGCAGMYGVAGGQFSAVTKLNWSINTSLHHHLPTNRQI